MKKLDTSKPMMWYSSSTDTIYFWTPGDTYAEYYEPITDLYCCSWLHIEYLTKDRYIHNYLEFMGYVK